MKKHDSTSHLIYIVSNYFPEAFMVSNASFNSPLIQHDAHFVSYGPICRQIDDKARCALGHGYCVIDSQDTQNQLDVQYMLRAAGQKLSCCGKDNE